MKEKMRKLTISADRQEQQMKQVIAEAEKKKIEAQKEIEETKKERDTLSRMQSKQSELINAEAAKRQESFRSKYSTVMNILAVYGGITTLFAIGRSERCVNDLIAAVRAVGYFFIYAYQLIAAIISGTASISFVLGAVSFVICLGIPVAGLYFGGKALVNCYTEHCWDEISPLVALCCFAILIWFAKFMPLNIVLLMILSHAAYIVVRWYIDGYRENH